MRHVIYDKISAWEAIAFLEIVQALGAPPETAEQLACVLENNQDLYPLFDVVEHVQRTSSSGANDHAWHFGQAYRAIEEDPRHSYQELLAKCNATDPKLGPLLAQCQLQPLRLTLPASQQNYLVFAPYSLKRDLELPETAWRHLAREMQTFAPVYFLGRAGQRLPRTEFAEAEIASEWPLQEKLQLLADAHAVLGAVNEWTWLAAGWQKQIAYTYPANIPARRWFMHAHENFGRILFQPAAVQVPILQAQMRVWLEGI